jgi:hypothetical protein
MALSDDELFGPEARALEEKIGKLVYHLKAADEESDEYRCTQRKLIDIRTDYSVASLTLEEYDLYLPRRVVSWRIGQAAHRSSWRWRHEEIIIFLVVFYYGMNWPNDAGILGEIAVLVTINLIRIRRRRDRIVISA